MHDKNAVDAYSPPEIAQKWLQLGAAKATLPVHRLAMLSIAAGAFIALGGLFYEIALTGWKGSYGVGQVLGGLVFNLGLALVCLAGGELFTGNSLLAIACADRRISTRQMVGNWAMVWLFNGVGALFIVFLAYAAQLWAGGDYMVGAKALSVGAAKAALPFGVAFARGIVANILVSLAVWAYSGGRSAADKIAAMLLPITAFVAMGAEHSIANLFFLPYAFLLKLTPSVASVAGVPTEVLSQLTLLHIGRNLLASTLGNVVGGALCVGLLYWFAYLWQGPERAAGGTRQAS